MSRSRFSAKGAFWGILLLAAGAFPLAAQSTDPPSVPSLEEVGARIRALRPEYEVALKAAAIADSMRTDSLRNLFRIPLDTIQVGPFRIVTPPDQVELARESFQDAWASFLPSAEGSEAALSHRLFVFRYAWRFGGIYLEGDSITNVEMSRRFGRRLLRQKVRSAIGTALMQGLPADTAGLVRWLGGFALSSPEDWGWIYRDLAATPSQAAKRCYQGDIPWCWEAMGLSSGRGGWEAWYTPEERRLMVEGKEGVRFFRRDARLRTPELLRHGCLVLKSDRACMEVLESWEAQVPLGSAARASLVSEALVMGGKGAYRRLVEDLDQPLRDRLAYTAGVPADTLMIRWREKVMAERPSVQAGLLLSPVSMVFWLLLFLYLATRSTRWRLG